MTEITREADMRLEVMQKKEGNQKRKRQIMSNWPGRRPPPKKKKKKKKNNKKQIKDWKKRYMPN